MEIWLEICLKLIQYLFESNIVFLVSFFLYNVIYLVKMRIVGCADCWNNIYVTVNEVIMNDLKLLIICLLQLFALLE